MKVFLYLCACIASSIAGIIGYPIGYPTYPGVVGHPITYSTIVRPLGYPYSGFHGYPLTLTPSYVSYNLLPGNVIFSTVPVFPHLPIHHQQSSGKGKPGKKKSDGKNKEQEDTTEEAMKEEEENKENGEADELNE